MQSYADFKSSFVLKKEVQYQDKMIFIFHNLKWTLSYLKLNVNRHPEWK